MRYVQAITAALAMTMLAALVACSSGSSSTPPPPPAISVSVSTTATSVNVNGTTRCSLRRFPTIQQMQELRGAVPREFLRVFQSARPQRAVLPQPLLLRLTFLRSATITATSVTDPTKSGTATIYVTGARQSLWPMGTTSTPWPAPTLTRQTRLPLGSPRLTS